MKLRRSFPIRRLRASDFVEQIVAGVEAGGGGSAGGGTDAPGGDHRAEAVSLSRTKELATDLRLRIREIAQARVRYGYRKIRVLLNREGWKVATSIFPGPGSASDFLEKHGIR